MTSTKSTFTAGPRPYESLFLRKKRVAFLTTALTAFCILCFFGSLKIKSYETTTSMDVSVSAQNTEDFFQKIIWEETKDARLKKHLELASENSSVPTTWNSDNIDFEQVRKSFDFRIAPRNDGNQFRLTAAYTGNGTTAERLLTQSVVRSMANRTMSTDNIALSYQAIDNQYQLIQNNIELNAGEIHDELTSTNGMIDDLNMGLSDIHEAVQTIRPDRSLDANFVDSNQQSNNLKDRERIGELLNSLQEKLGLIETANDERELYQLGASIAKINDQLKNLELPAIHQHENKSMRIINAALPDSNSAVKAVLELLENLDTDAIQTRIGQMQSNMRSNAIQLREDVAGLKSLTNKLTESRFVVNSISQAKTLPTGDKPHTGHVLMYCFLAFGIGMTTATLYRPELDGMGFESLEDTAETLGIPAITGLSAATDRPSKPADALANAVVRYSEFCLFGFVLLTVMLCLIQPEIRNAFFESPFYGLAKNGEHVYLVYLPGKRLTRFSLIDRMSECTRTFLD